MMKTFSKSLLAFAVLAGLAACDSDNRNEITPPAPAPGPDPAPAPQPAPSALKLGILPDTQGGGWAVAMHPMEAVLAKHQAEGVNLVIPVGDLTDNGSTEEWAQWRSVAQKYKDAGMEFLPVMGNHETSWAYTVEWIDNMRHFIPEDAVHMPTAEWINYYVIRDNVLVIGLAYYNLPLAFNWIQQVLAEREGEFDHVVIASHDGLVGAKYGETREQIVEGTKGDNRLLDIHKAIRDTFAKYDVIWVQGHEHMYQRSQIHAGINSAEAPQRVAAAPLSSTPEGGNYRMPSYTQIIAGNASYKGYEYRYGERELIQDVIQHKMATKKNGSEHYDANAAILSFDGDRVDYHAYATPHTVSHNEDGARELSDPSWTLIDTFSRSRNRCESIIYPNSIPEGQRPVLEHLVEFKTADCVGDDGSSARLVGGINNTFNRVDSTERSMGFHQGLSRAESMNDLMRLAYQYLFTYHQSWDPNLNGANRVIPGEQGEDGYGATYGEVVIPATTIDLKKHVTLSWQPAEKATASEVLLVSGMQNHGGVYQSAYGATKDLRSDTGMPGSNPDGSAKAPHTRLPESASQGWDAATNLGDRYGVQFSGDAGVDAAKVQLGWKRNGEWQAVTVPECVIEAAWNQAFLASAPERPAHCDDQPLIGYDSQFGNRWWLIADRDLELALLPR